MRALWGIAPAAVLAFLCQAILASFDPLALSCNPKGAGGLGLPGAAGHALALGFLGLLAFLLGAEERRGARMGLILMLGGGLSNEFERLFRGCVADYLPLFGISAFNPADLLLLAGALFYAASFFQKKTA